MNVIIQDIVEGLDKKSKRQKPALLILVHKTKLGEESKK